MSEPTDLPPGTERGPSVAADDTEPASPPGRVAGFKDKSEELRERADETWKRVEAARSQKPFVDVAFETYERDRDHLGPLLSAAIAFRLFLVFVPFVALGMIVLGFFDFEASDLRNAGLVGLTAQSITASGNQPLWSQLLTLIVVVWAMLLAARSLVKALRLTHAVAWDLERRPLKDTTKTALWVLAVAALALMATGVARQLRQISDALGLVATISVFVIYLATWLAVSKILPRPDGTSWITMLPGSALFALGAQVFQLAVVFWIVPRIDNAQDHYGALGLAIVLLGGIYLIGRLMVVAAFLNATLWFRTRRLAEAAPLPGDESP